MELFRICLTVVLLATFVINRTSCQQPRRTTLFNRFPTSIRNANPRNTHNEPEEEEECPPQITCESPPSRFYTIDGSCNNPLDASIGQSRRPHKRLLPADYADGRGKKDVWFKTFLQQLEHKYVKKYELPKLMKYKDASKDYANGVQASRQPRRAANGRELPSARLVSTTVQFSKPPKSSIHTHILVLWGQFLAHDITLTPTIEAEGFDCADCEEEESACFNIAIPRSDPIRGEERRTCLPLRRSVAVPDAHCNSSVRQQENDLTPFLDGGVVYGNNEFQFNELLDERSRIGKLLVGILRPHGSSTNSAPALPLQTQVDFVVPEGECRPEVHRPEGVPCFAAGDDRVNENTALASFHTLFLRLHNKLVEGLNRVNPQWSRDELINNARSIVTAVIQRITYKEFLPEILGEGFMQRFGLNLDDQGYWFGYDSSFDATTSNAFATAAMRFGHTLLTSPLSRPSPNFRQSQGTSLPLQELFFNSIPLLTTNQGGANSILRGLSSDAAETADTTFIEDIHNFLFRPRDSEFGEDLLSLNIQRGRDHGLPGYNEYREFCGLNRATVFGDFFDIDRDPLNRLISLYTNVDDIDLYIGALAQDAVEGGLFGATFACILGYQFRDIRRGDRLWHENGGDLAVFTPDQLQSIREFTLARLLCELDDMTSIQPKPFRQTSVRGNGRRPCRSNDGLNLNPWKVSASHSISSATSMEYTAWFASSNNGVKHTAQQLLHFLLRTRPDDVCAKTLGVEERTVRGNKQYRYRCPSGSIRGTDYPNVDASKGVWTEWTDNSTPQRLHYSDDETRNNPPPACVEPIAIQVFTLDMVPARQTNEVFSTFSINSGFACRGSDQEDGRCQDYQVRYFCKRIRSLPNFPPLSKAAVKSQRILCRSFGVCCDGGSF